MVFYEYTYLFGTSPYLLIRSVVIEIFISRIMYGLCIAESV